MSRVCLDVAITFMIYDSFMEMFNKVWPWKNLKKQVIRNKNNFALQRKKSWAN
jgi:hypothetical protein